ncbi:hypothetical protein TanjilG_21994 [Lupinus angustifolius]|uniref:ZF-HD dimerization-type domain-containing protein n=1 Tax=Lupinus angustifolius TaxID=3871 RepID=A0A4P1QTJ0_LUPAN|nr:PREDICTED: zinc-finger homeodomain protein 6-like [Lupinus angustifolius]XP_019421336.1 PREDICTED: zinc-finger homeodomain protein 6-like [Lupinus angustifolius]XP_019421337.1 PREDICTED: zinc-finger homeodomain protein 6-like [Lupinus angustifolius]XP_019421338.1 PREDICTED: zinc-finger homeodomain protein 6-like [Lupinus angustifolius]OIV94797.1 hypothetical protein TanjilG_21994 [Lupinus angustifolius]
MRGQEDKEIEMPTTLGYNRDSSSSSSKLSSPTAGETSVHHQPFPASQTPTLIFNDQPQTSHQATTQLHQSQEPSTDPDLSSFPVVTTSITITPIASIPIPPRTAPPQTTITAIATTTALIRYRECLRNHAASMGSHVVDGCGEFMPSGEEGTPESLKCAACDCHRNFHRKETEGEPQQHASNYHSYHPNKHNNTHNIIPSPPLPHHNHSHLQFHTPSSSMHHRFSHGVANPTSLIPPMIAFGGGGGGAAESSSEDLNMFQSNRGGEILMQPPSMSKKRFRTKFTQQQKERMMEFAEKLGWKIQKQDEQEVQQFCSQVGVRRQVFKVWIHNNKQAMKKQQM